MPPARFNPFAPLIRLCRRIADHASSRRAARREYKAERRRVHAEIRRLEEQKQQEAAENLLIESQARSIADLQHKITAANRSYEDLQQKLTLAEEALAQQIEINRRDRERVAWETAHFSRLIEQEKHAGRLAGQPAVNPVSQLLNGL